ncbi:glucose-1-phosphate cytidylyltransferase [Ruficoccus amylovorans]|uniref:Glucose-1-phosphate cytidylyltransferase n=1 Tax=Ruficoccus amylovorans TaxID=1804625 RepID=A0A842HBC5_9BACT|nr:glucose-1-phosphate cytidylyltransferase [Ruficoccus amylovorans]MBC2593449.1 glucose-1-phosphate cytidylyltransferase [Ruficoccus amylovorans]
MKVVILCGGKGTRLRQETEYRPKPMVSIGAYPILWHIMKIYAHHGHRDFVLCLGYKGEMIKEYFRDYLWNTGDVTLKLGSKSDIVFHDKHDEEDWSVTLAETGPESMTARRIKMIQRHIPDGEPFLLTYGDGLADININAAIAAHQASGKACTLSAVHPAGRFGSIGIENDGRIHYFQEKPQVESAYINGGFLVCEHRVFDYLGDDNIMFEREPITRLVEAGELNAYRHEGWWQPMDTYQESEHLNQLWSSGKAPWKCW